MKNKTVKNIVIIAIWLLIWQILSLVINNSIVLAGPLNVFIALIKNLFSLQFYLRILNSTAMIFLGFFLATILGIILSGLSYKYGIIEDFLKPLMVAIKSVPVASFVVILLIWFGSVRLSVYIAFLIVLPNIYVATLEGLGHHDKNFKNLAGICKLQPVDQIKYLYWPAVYPYLVSGMKTSIGLAWKSGVAAEVIGMSKNTLGERLYVSKVYLENDELFAWTLVVVFLCFAFEKIVIFLVERLGNHHFKPLKISYKAKERSLPFFSSVSKSFGENLLFTDLTIDFKKAKNYMLVAPSGVGKSTVLSLMTGIEKPDSGNIEIKNVSIAFQDEIFLENYTALENLRIFTPVKTSDEEIVKIASKVLEKDALCKPVSEFSGGMKRRLSVLRALLCPSDLVLLDEPFSGLDKANKEALSKLILELTKDRYLLFTGHYEADADLLNAERINLWKQE
ncbi:MAG: ATP-binding cassette domain-containing protein [Lachnospiraceae bacterium]|nr:ATP-binding cassette domain-containing protein [Lachnospiraceae bacterium]